MEKTCTCEGVEIAAKKAYDDMIKQEAPKFLAYDTAFEILNGDWVNCKCAASKLDKDE